MNYTIDNMRLPGKMLYNRLESLQMQLKKISRYACRCGT